MRTSLYFFGMFFTIAVLWLILFTVPIYAELYRSDFESLVLLVTLTAICVSILGGLGFKSIDHQFFSEEAEERKLRIDLIRHQRELLKLSERTISGEMKDSSEALQKASQNIQAETEALLNELRERRKKHVK